LPAKNPNTLSSRRGPLGAFDKVPDDPDKKAFRGAMIEMPDWHFRLGECRFQNL
jgi:hypothetical protein